MDEIKKLDFFDRFLLLALFVVLLVIVIYVSVAFSTMYILIGFNIIFLFSIIFYLMLFLNNPSVGSAKPPKSFPSVSIVVPVYNSINTIENCIKSLKKLKYPKKIEIIVVDDGSTDGTREYLKKMRGIKLVLLKKNSGTAVATNTGLKLVKSEFVICIDSDSYPEEDLLFKTLGYFEDKSVGAVTCLVLPDKKNSVLQKVQYFEYLSSFGLNNALLSSIGASYVAPGPMTIFRNSVFKKIGYYAPGNLAQDMDIGLKLKKAGLKIMVCSKTIVLTDIPKNWKGLFKQRDRWSRGGAFNFIKYKSLMFNKLNPDFGFFVMPFMLFTQVLAIAVLIRLAVVFISDFYEFLNVFLNYLALGGAPIFTFSLDLIPASYFFFIFAYAVISAYFWLSFSFAKKTPSLFDLPVLLVLIFIYPYFITVVYAQGYFKEVFGVRAKWVRVST